MGVTQQKDDGKAGPCDVAVYLRQMKPVRYFGKTAAVFVAAWLSWPLVQAHCVFFIGLILPSVTAAPETKHLLTT